MAGSGASGETILVARTRGMWERKERERGRERRRREKGYVCGMGQRWVRERERGDTERGRERGRESISNITF